MSGSEAGFRLFGFDLSGATGTKANSTIRYLERAWVAEHGTEPLDLDEDLNLLRPIFQSHVTGQRVREYVKELPRIPATRPFIPEALFISVDSERGIVTPEGRAIIEIARTASIGDLSENADVISEQIALFYGRSLRSWIGKAVDTGLLPMPSAGFVVFLLINGSVGEAKAMRFPNNKDEEPDLAQIVMSVASAFSVGIKGPPIGLKERAQLRTSWVVSQALRHLGGNLTRGAKGNRGVGSIWVDEGHSGHLVAELAASIRSRGLADRGDLDHAFDDALAAYEEGRVLLGAWGISHERRRQTEELRTQLLTAFDGARA